MNSTQLKDYFRAQVRDDVYPYLWSDSEIYVYMNDAQKMFVRLTNGIFDVSSCATEVDVIAGEKYSDLHPSILTIREAYLANGDKLKIVNLGDADTLYTSDYGVVKSLSVQNLPGKIQYMVIGEEKGKCRWIMIPQENTTVTLKIARLPLTDITKENQKLELDSEHHIHLIEWMKHLAYNKHDGDTFNPTASAESDARFRIYCDFVWKEWERYRHKPRSVVYGGL